MKTFNPNFAPDNLARAECFPGNQVKMRRKVESVLAAGVCAIMVDWDNTGEDGCNRETRD